MEILIGLLVLVVIILIVRNSGNSKREEELRQQKLQQQRLANQARQRAEAERIRAEEEQRLKTEAVRLAEIEHLEAERARKEREAALERMKGMRDKPKESRAAQGFKDGYVYILSNEASFGEDKFKIGMTRRAEPLKRVRELNSASVPFDFTVRALFKVEQASDVEQAFHNKLHLFRMNQEKKKEFFDLPKEALIQSVYDLGLDPSDLIKSLNGEK